MSKPLVSTDELIAHLGDPAWRIFDCRHDLQNVEYGADAYAKGHIPGATFLHLDRDLSGEKNGRNGRHPLPDPAVFAQRLGAWGVGPDTQVVAYDNEGGVFASRFWWMLRWLGHDNVALLDGGLPGWRRAKQALVTETPVFAPTAFPVRPQALTVDAGFGEDFEAHVSQTELVIGVVDFAKVPHDKELYAEGIVAAWRDGAGSGVVTFNGKMIERLHVDIAERVLAIHKAVSA